VCVCIGSARLEDFNDVVPYSAAVDIIRIRRVTATYRAVTEGPVIDVRRVCAVLNPGI